MFRSTDSSRSNLTLPAAYLTATFPSNAVRICHAAGFDCCLRFEYAFQTGVQTTPGEVRPLHFKLWNPSKQLVVLKLDNPMNPREGLIVVSTAHIILFIH